MRQHLLAEADKRVRVLLTEESSTTKAAQTPDVDLPSIKEVLEYTISESRTLNETLKNLGLTGNIRKRILSLHGSAVARLLTQIDPLLNADQAIMDSTPTAQRRVTIDGYSV